MDRGSDSSERDQNRDRDGGCAAANASIPPHAYIMVYAHRPRSWCGHQRRPPGYHPPVSSLVQVRLARPGDIPAMQEIEIAAGRLFAEIGMQDVADDGAHETEVLAGYVADGRAWSAEHHGAVCGYALVDVVDGAAHLEQVSVHPDQGRRGIGSHLIDVVAAWAIGRGFTALTLLTFSDVAWNGPYYRRLGFIDVPDADLGHGLAGLRAHEAELGLDVSIRRAMRRDLR